MHFVVRKVFIGRAMQLGEGVASNMFGRVSSDVLDELGDGAVGVLGLYNV